MKDIDIGMSVILWIPWENDTIKLVKRVVDDCRLKTNLNKEAILDELSYALENKGEDVGLYMLEYSFILEAVKDKLTNKRIQKRTELEDLEIDLMKRLKGI